MPTQTTTSVPLATADQLRASARWMRRVGHLKGSQVDGQALAEVFEVASFYHHYLILPDLNRSKSLLDFSFSPRERHFQIQSS